MRRGVLRGMCEDSYKVEKKFTQFIKHKVGNLTTFGKANFLGVEESAYI